MNLVYVESITKLLNSKMLVFCIFLFFFAFYHVFFCVVKQILVSLKRYFTKRFSGFEITSTINNKDFHTFLISDKASRYVAVKPNYVMVVVSPKNKQFTCSFRHLFEYFYELVFCPYSF